MATAAASSLLEPIRQACADSGIDAVGVTDVAPFTHARRAIEERKAAGLHAGMWFTYGRPERSTTPADILPGARSMVVCARRYRPPDAGDRRFDRHRSGTVAAYAADDAYVRLRAGLDRVCSVLEAGGARAVTVCDDNRLVDRAAAVRAGLGWLGRNTMLLSRELGSWNVLGSVITTAALPVSDHMQTDGCGSCRICQSACPTGALDTAGVLDANRCLAWLLQAPGVFAAQYRVALGDRLYGCDDCQAMCPVNDPAAEPLRSRPRPVNIRHRRSSVDVVEMLRMADDELMAAFGHWYVPRRQPAYLRRNALVVLGNVGDPGSPAVEEVLRRALSSPNAMIAAHAVWTARRLGRDDLVAQARAGGLEDRDADGLVAAELARPVCVARTAS
ncbi:tRNA epoxyqueuosine(34) reductase QueG [Candidatus Poriferisodalis sp.]|uniref:tRNA epoxyqueuosine(34) reductase QueG n=1 Tax=Candidatus Poriferisodalis sp. TaxID=3101277 RepID=UPI003B02534F